MRHRKLSRRNFLQMGVALGAATILPPRIIAQEDAPDTVLIPPSIMLHSRESRYTFLTTLMAGINERGWETITYQEYLRRAVEGESLDGTILISIDDIEGVRGNPSLEYFNRIAEWIGEAGGTATFGVITQPEMEHDEASWDVIANWARDGFELATHTATHPTFNAPDTSPRHDFDQGDMDYQIVESARMIEGKMADRDIDITVQTLITPFGSGWNRETFAIHPGIVTACETAGIRFVVGIVDGRDALPRADFESDDAVIYTGRTPPGYLPDNGEGRALDADLTLGYISGWGW